MGQYRSCELQLEARIVNENGEDVPRGGVGELIVRGNGVMKGITRTRKRRLKPYGTGGAYRDMAKEDDDGLFTG
jgi:non-ribosomal peptide synthetase component E (peptide arylation enzyme)